MGAFFFRKMGRDERFEQLNSLMQEKSELDTGFWVWDGAMAGKARKPFRGELRPDNSQ